MSPAASSARMTERVVEAVNPYHTEPLSVGAQLQAGSTGSSVDSTVVPRTVAGNGGRMVAAARASLAGGAAAAGAAPSRLASVATATATDSRRPAPHPDAMSVRAAARPMAQPSSSDRRHP